MIYTATYSPEDNKLRLSASQRLDAETYARVKAAGFKWAPVQGIFVAPMWTPKRAALCEELAGEIGDEDVTLVERAEERAGRFDEYSDKRAADSAAAAEAVRRIADGIPLGQPILIGHHSEKHARKDAERIENGMRKAVKMWETAKYWTDRAAGALAHAKYKERPDVRARRIKKIEADLRKVEKNIAHSEFNMKLWADPLARLKRKDGAPITLREAVIHCANMDHGYWAGPLSLWEAAGGNIDNSDPEAVAIATPEEICAKAIANHREYIARASLWRDHYKNRLAYERAMMAESGGTASDKTGPEVGGACRCWASPFHQLGWSLIQKVNKVSVTVLDNWGNNGPDFPRTIPFDKLKAMMSRAEVDAARAEGRLLHEDKRGFMLADAPIDERPAYTVAKTPADIEGMRASLEAGVAVAVVPQLFPTPREVAEMVVDLAQIEPGQRVLEPSAGTGALLGAIGGRMFGHNPERGEVVAVEINQALADRLRDEFPLTDVRAADFLKCNGDLGKFDRIIMNPPFKNGDDIRHILHARNFLNPGGRLVAICANGPRQNDALRPLASEWEPLPEGSFKDQGTGVSTAVLVIEA